MMVRPNLRLLTRCTLLLSGAFCSCNVPITDPPLSVGTDIGLRALMSPWDALPALHARSYEEFSSYDRLPDLPQCLTDAGNKDFNNFLAMYGIPEAVAFSYVDNPFPFPCLSGMSGYIIAATTDGPGYISRIWLTSIALSTFATGELFDDEETISVYLDGSLTPAYRGFVKDWEMGGQAPFTEPLVGYRSGGYVSYVPISFRSNAYVVLGGLSPAALYYYQVDIQTSAEDTVVFNPERFTNVGTPGIEESLAARFDRNIGNRWANTHVTAFPSCTLAPNSQVEVAEFLGAGTIMVLEFVFPTVTLGQLRDLDLLITWDDMPSPAVDAPLSAFYGEQLALSEYDSLPMRVRRSTRGLETSCRFPMPFRNHASVQIRNNGAEAVVMKPGIAYSNELPDEDWGYFWSEYNCQETPSPTDGYYPIVDVLGRGKYLGTFLFLEGHADEAHSGNMIPIDPMNFLEGDTSGTIDGSWRVRGTGTEDYLNGALYFRSGRYEYGFSGVNHLAVDDDDRACVSGYRWHLLTDEINFMKSFQLSLEYGQGRPNTVDRYQSVAYYYLAQYTR